MSSCYFNFPYIQQFFDDASFSQPIQSYIESFFFLLNPDTSIYYEMYLSYNTVITKDYFLAAGFDNKNLSFYETVIGESSIGVPNGQNEL